MDSLFSESYATSNQKSLGLLQKPISPCITIEEAEEAVTTMTVTKAMATVTVMTIAQCCSSCWWMAFGNFSQCG